LVFTLIQKFRWEKGKTYPLLSPRSDIIVIVDEAHRTQYKDLAENMRAGLKNAQFIAFTGTPLLGKERKTNQWFGGYVSEYNFPRRGYLGKGMVVSLDKFTAVKMYDKVQRLWREQIKELRGKIKKSGDDGDKKLLQKQLDYMRTVEMAVVVSEEGDEEKKFAKQKLNIKPRRDRINRLDEHGHDIEYNFKDPENPLQLVFVCAMWLTGFDAPTLSTLYLDK